MILTIRGELCSDTDKPLKTLGLIYLRVLALGPKTGDDTSDARVHVDNCVYGDGRVGVYFQDVALDDRDGWDYF